MRFEQVYFEIPVNVYDPVTGHVSIVTMYLDDARMDANNWKTQMLTAQKLGRRLAYSNEWVSAGYRELPLELDFDSNIKVWTGTVLDFDNGTLKEGIVLNEDGSIASVKTVLGEKEGIYLPHESARIVDFDEKYMRLMSYLFGTADPRTEIRAIDIMHFITKSPRGKKPTGLRPVVHGAHGTYSLPFSLTNAPDPAVYIDVGYSPHKHFCAWAFDENLPQSALTRKEYKKIKKELSKKTLIMPTKAAKFD